MMKIFKLYAILLLTTIIVACAPHAPKAGSPRITMSPSPCKMEIDESRKGKVDVQINVPAQYFSRRSRLVIVPQLMSADSATIGELRPVVLDASIYSKKKARKEKLEHYIDPYASVAQRVDKSRPITLQYADSFMLPEPHSEAFIEAQVSADGCGSCTGFERVNMAQVTVKEPEPIEPEPAVEPEPTSLGLTWIEPEFVVKPKIMKGEGTAHLQFIINKYDIVPELGNNKSELEQMVEKLEPILNDSLATITGISIYGMASADGPLSLNTPLSANRAKSAKMWLAERLNMSESLVAKIKTGSRPEGWQPVLEAMTKAGNRDSVKVKDILTRYAGQNDDVQERYIRRLACWPTIRDNYLQKDRKVDYTYSWTIRSFTTDAELVAMYKTRPDAFNEEELLRVASLSADDKSRMMVYRYTLSRFPTSRIAANNLAILLEREGKYEEARRIYEAQKVLESINE